MSDEEEILKLCRRNARKIEDNEMAEGQLICKMMDRVEALEREVAALKNYLEERRWTARRPH